MCRGLLAKCVNDCDIKRSVATKYGISTRSVERYLRRAREQMVAETGQPKDVLRAESVEFYRTVCQTQPVRGPDGEPPLVTTRDRLLARERIDRVLGLEAPQKLEHSGRDGGPLTFAAIMASAERSAPAIEGDAGNVVDVEAELAKIRAAHG